MEHGDEVAEAVRREEAGGGVTLDADGRLARQVDVGHRRGDDGRHLTTQLHAACRELRRQRVIHERRFHLLMLHKYNSKSRFINAAKSCTFLK